MPCTEDADLNTAIEETQNFICVLGQHKSKCLISFENYYFG